MRGATVGSATEKRAVTAGNREQCEGERSEPSKRTARSAVRRRRERHGEASGERSDR